MEPTFWPDTIDAHRLLVQMGADRTTARYESDQKIFSQGEPADLVFFVQDGRVKLVVTTEAGLDEVIGIAQPGQFFGEACLHDVPVRIATAVAVGECRITSVTREAILSAIHQRPCFAKLFLDCLLERNSWTQKGLLDHLLDFEAVS